MEREIKDLVISFDREGFFKEVPTKEELGKLSQIFMVENVRWLTKKYKSIILDMMFTLLSCDFYWYKEKAMYIDKDNIIVRFDEYNILNQSEFEIVKNNILEYFKEYNVFFREEKKALVSNAIIEDYSFIIPIKEVKNLNKNIEEN